MNSARRLPTLFAALALAGCAVGPDFHRPAGALPGAYGNAPAPAAPSPGGAAVSPAQWWRALADPGLDALVGAALHDNPGLAAALARLQQAREFEAAVTGLALPRIDAASGGGRGTGSDLSRGGHVPGALAAADRTGGGIAKITQVSGAQALWDIDVFGGLRREMEAAHDDAQAAAAARDAVQVALIADVVRYYVQLRGAQTQQAVLRQSVEAANRLLDLVQARFERGITNELDVTLARRQLAAAQADLAPLQAQADAAAGALAVLAGRFPEAMRAQLAVPAMLPALPTAIAPGQPLELLRRRPDIRAAEWELAAATARVGVAVASLFPRLTLSAATGVQAQGLGTTPGAHQSIWSVGYAAGLPLLDFGTLDALASVADLQAREALLRYRATVLAAVRDVDAALSAYSAQQQRVQRLGEAVLAGQRATALAAERYDRGLTDFLNVIDAQRAQYDLEAQYAVAQTAAAGQFVALYQALGGGWESFEPPDLRMAQPAVVALFRRLLAPAPYLSDAAKAAAEPLEEAPATK